MGGPTPKVGGGKMGGSYGPHRTMWVGWAPYEGVPPMPPRFFFEGPLWDPSISSLYQRRGIRMRFRMLPFGFGPLFDTLAKGSSPPPKWGYDPGVLCAPYEPGGPHTMGDPSGPPEGFLEGGPWDPSILTLEWVSSTFTLFRA